MYLKLSHQQKIFSCQGTNSNPSVSEQGQTVFCYNTGPAALPTINFLLPDPRVPLCSSPPWCPPGPPSPGSLCVRFVLLQVTELLTYQSPPFSHCFSSGGSGTSRASGPEAASGREATWQTTVGLSSARFASQTPHGQQHPAGSQCVRNFSGCQVNGKLRGTAKSQKSQGGRQEWKGNAPTQKHWI